MIEKYEKFTGWKNVKPEELIEKKQDSGLLKTVAVGTLGFIAGVMISIVWNT